MSAVLRSANRGHLGQPGARFSVTSDAIVRANARNFSAGPGALPQKVLDELQQAIQCVPDVGLSILGISHRSDWFRAVMDETESIIRGLLGLDDEWHVLFLQGGSSLQFSMVPLNMGCLKDTPADFVVSGYWSRKVLDEARSVCHARCAWSGAANCYTRLPGWAEIAVTSGAAFVHLVTNETIEGLQYPPELPHLGLPLVCDMSSDFLSRPLDLKRCDLVYAHAQKNLGPAGVTVVLVREHMIRSAPGTLPPMLDYRTHISARSIYNTPPVLAIYTMNLVLRWLRDDIGGLDRMAMLNQQKANAIYNALDQSEGFYRTHAARENRSAMNIAFRVTEEGGDAKFLAAASKAGFSGLEGHRSLGGCRVSIYNAVNMDAAMELAAFLKNYAGGN